ncbi:hypothetical protein BDZ89DRAFT_1067507 [Hymenopellis radicata]|nr:hypothetical protein BDZ89DRAFT_1067507 [Hymenopellis radicata]
MCSERATSKEETTKNNKPKENKTQRTKTSKISQDPFVPIVRRFPLTDEQRAHCIKRRRLSSSYHQHHQHNPAHHRSIETPRSRNMNQERSRSGSPRMRPPLSSSSSNYLTSQPSSCPRTPSMASTTTFSTARESRHTTPHTSLSRFTTPAPPTPHTPQCPPAPGPLRPSSSFYPQKQSDPAAIPGAKACARGGSTLEYGKTSTTLRPPIKLGPHGTWLAEEEYKPQTQSKPRLGPHGTHLNLNVPTKS